MQGVRGTWKERRCGGQKYDFSNKHVPTYVKLYSMDKNH